MAKVLVVDDAKIMRMSIKKMLLQLGYAEVFEASSGYEAVKQYKMNKPDFVTMDITMPAHHEVNDGIDAVKQIREFDSNAKIIMITSHGEQDKVIQAIQNGASNYILKPLQIDKLEDVIKKLNIVEQED